MMNPQPNTQAPSALNAWRIRQIEKLSAELNATWYMLVPGAETPLGNAPPPALAKKGQSRKTPVRSGINYAVEYDYADVLDAMQPGDEFDFAIKPGHNFEDVRGVIAAGACRRWGNGIVRTYEIETAAGSLVRVIRRAKVAA